MKLRKLRIAFSATCLIACTLLIVLWVRSYWRTDHIVWTDKAGTFAISTHQGKLTIEVMNDRVLLPQGWSHGSFPIYDDDWIYNDDSSSDDELKTLLGFGWQTKDGSITAAVPVWFLASTCAVLPWIRWRFSLRTLLIATTLVAVVLGLIVAVTRQ